MSDNLEILCGKLHRAKQLEGNMKLERVRLEQEITAIVATKNEGTDKAEAGVFRVSVTSKLTRTLDYKAYLGIESDLPVGVRCVDLKPTLNLKKLRALEMVDPSLPALFITTKPAKAAVVVEVNQEAA